MLDDSLPLTPPEFKEWGNPKDQEYFHYMKSYSPYDNVTAKKYPHIFVTAGLNDPRVTYWEPAKWVAKLREYKTDDNLLVFETNMDAGHAGASGRFGRYRDVAKEYNFIFKIYNIKVN
jgi:oligopeptidase B